ncbi:DUF4651 domain-containing protein [Streptococcus ovuberis]|uniref:DUF4651 domain-containing protein n=1 Tax=Streptococcus ovuberis TaxID=1936207 RepID=A0A7X6MYP2_9STRE|nr:DUF4651 domain-containing protein [Streptococcus ovuberis]NKZ20820.1 DUF4651 domain-containing protein [Streptococcus ovuberis]
MKKRTAIALAGLVGLTCLAVGTKAYLDYQEEERMREILLQVRAFFAPMGEIATVFVDYTVSDQLQTKGGVIMTDGRFYHFDYLAGELFFEEDTL